MTSVGISEACSPKRGRPLSPEVEARRRQLLELTREGQPCTVRNVYYRAVVAGIIPKTTTGYQTVQRDLAFLRRERRMPFQWLVDHTRLMRKPDVYDSVEQALSDVARFYRRDLWTYSPWQIEVWAESQSIAGVVADVTDTWALPLMATKGYSSMSFTYSAAQQMNYDGRDVQILYIGDHDPDGLAIERNLVEGLRGHLSVPAQITRVGVTWDQVEQYDLPGGTPKKSYGFPMAVEAEALPAPTLRRLLEEAIALYVDEDQLHRLRVAEQSEREQLLLLSRGGIR
jgi:hypothetical protein